MRRTLFSLLCGLLLCPVHVPAGTLPKPTGKHLVGVTYLAFVDTSRKELFDNEQKSDREITVKAWYPTDGKSEPEPYFLLAEADFAVKYLQFPETFRELTTNSSRDVPLSSKEKRYPVLVFSHGWGEHYSQNSILMEELASRGYIVFSMAHHYECKFSSYPDGRLLRIDMGNLRFQKIMGEMSNPKAMELMQRMFQAADDGERMRVFEEMEQVLPTGLVESPKYWAQDISYFLDRLKGMNTGEGLFKGRLDLDRIGVFGMSMGGIASSEISLSDGRIKACVNVDGGISGATLHRKLTTPTMFLSSKRYVGYGALFTGKSTKDCYSFSVRNSDHYNLTDYSIYPVPAVTFLLGSIDGMRTIEIMNVLVPAFFDRYLTGRKDIDLMTLAGAYPEVDAASNVGSK